MKNAYKKFAYFYDEVMSEMNYDLWVEFTQEFIKKDDKILDLACGTGTFVTMLKLNGYDFVEGSDLSDEIIEIANEIGLFEIPKIVMRPTVGISAVIFLVPICIFIIHDKILKKENSIL